MDGLKAGMTRADLLKVFEAEGCFQVREKQTFFSRACTYFQVDVEFEVRPSSERDVITSISRPYLKQTIRIC
jgi:hypothetical protein